IPTGADALVSGPLDGSDRRWLAILDRSAAEVRTYAQGRDGRWALLWEGDAGPSPSGLSVQRVVGSEGEGRYDLLVGTEQGNVYRLEGHGDGTFEAPECVLDNVAMAVGDLTGDGKTDFLIADERLGTISLVEGDRQTVIADHVTDMMSPGAVR